MASIRVPVALGFILSLFVAGYLGFSSIQLSYDKLVHFLTFLILTIEFYFIFDTSKLKVLRYVTFICCTLVGGILSEFIQNIINPQRVFDIEDIAYNIGGSLVGLAICWIQGRRRRRRIEDDYVNISMDDVAIV